ncbi:MULTISPECIES: response regulator transcription factor [Ralstonia]|uniref:response regulator transcription factor n=1 Tax=Ralstonia TaxID=48736 RepID=UPI0004CF4DD2|nr:MULTISPECIES: response regulator transcription factor [Ralstonia]MBY4707277.1 response regulator transcription factor [Ralstonia insidiosa]
MNTPIRVLLADDHPAVIAGVSAAIEQEHDIRISAAASSSTEIVAFLDHQPCDVLLTDYAMPGGDYGDGVPLLSFLTRRYPALRIVVLTMLDNPAILAGIVATGVHGVLSKSDDVEHIPLALRAAMQAQMYVSPTMQAILKASRELQGPSSRPLTRREMEVIRLFVSGLSIGDIAQRLNRGKQTISTQKIMAMRKLGIEREADLFRYAIEMGLISSSASPSAYMDPLS